MVHFSPLSAAVGGALIGLAVTILWIANGRTAGISGVVGGMVPLHRGDALWRVIFLVGLPIGGWLGTIAGPTLFVEIPKTLPVIDLSAIGLVTSGLLVGIGTRISRGCTSGHGLCGLARLSLRSFVAVGTFMATAIVTVFIGRHVG